MKSPKELAHEVLLLKADELQEFFEILEDKFNHNTKILENQKYPKKAYWNDIIADKLAIMSYCVKKWSTWE